LKRPRWLRRPWQAALAGALAAGVLAYAAIGAFIFRHAQGLLAHPPQRPADAALVLGSRAYLDGQPHPCLAGRVDTALAMAKTGLVKQLAFSGGVDSEDGRTEANAMRERAVAQGFAGPMLLEPASTSTRLNLSLSRPLLLAAGVRSVVIVSEPFHLWRIERLCRTPTSAAGWRRCTAAGAAARHRADAVGLARLLCLARARRAGGQQPGAGRACAEGRQAAAQGAGRRRRGAAWPSFQTPRPTPGSRPATRPSSSCCTAAACAWANWGSTCRRATRRAAGSTWTRARRTCWARAASAASCRWAPRRPRRCALAGWRCAAHRTGGTRRRRGAVHRRHGTRACRRRRCGSG
jgi:uncharacterized SAM-binding protein YcdF (DUF218 family)